MWISSNDICFYKSTTGYLLLRRGLNEIKCRIWKINIECVSSESALWRGSRNQRVGKCLGEAEIFLAFGILRGSPASLLSSSHYVQRLQRIISCAGWRILGVATIEKCWLKSVINNEILILKLAVEAVHFYKSCTHQASSLAKSRMRRGAWASIFWKRYCRFCHVAIYALFSFLYFVPSSNITFEARQARSNQCQQ